MLQLALEQAISRYNDDHNYSAACEQLKTIRQDIVAGRIEDMDFTKLVYETHARLALAANDLAELRACLGMLRQLHNGQGGEFAALGLLFALLAHVGGAHKDVLALELRDVATRGLLDDEHVRAALQFCRAVLAGHYAGAAGCTTTEDNALKRAVRERLALRTCRVVLAAFLPTLPVDRVRSMLGIDVVQLPENMFVISGDVVDVRASRARR